MRGICFSRLVTARAILAGALIAGGASRPAFSRADQASSPEETAFAQARVTLPAGPGGLGLPQPLSAADAARIRRILAWQRQGDLPRAIAETAKLTDDTLLGDVLADRLLRQSRAPAPALAAWLGRYADLPDAAAISARLARALPPGSKPSKTPAPAMLGSADQPHSPDGGAAARAALVRGRNAAAWRIGAAAWRRSRFTDAASAYVAGLAAWRDGSVAAARTMFEAAAAAPDAAAATRAAGAFWAARTALDAGDLLGWKRWITAAAAFPRTLHGRIARHALGAADPPAPAPHLLLATADLDAIAATWRGRRAFALLQVGETARAETELRALWPTIEADPPLARAALLVARALAMPTLAADMSAALGWDDPPPKLHPAGGFMLSPPLVYAVARVESNFDAAAGSGMGASGLMQLRGDVIPALGAPARANLRDPGTNLKLGQRYLAYLAGQSAAGDNLLRVLAAYNAGPGALSHWNLGATDPLMFLEILPNAQTRRYVQATLGHLWGYAARLGLSSPSLDALAAGEWPRFSAELARLQ